jgi:hypothetical protein
MRTILAACLAADRVGYVYLRFGPQSRDALIVCRTSGVELSRP